MQIVTIIALFCFKNSFPLNFLFLTTFTLLISWLMGTVAYLYKATGQGAV